MNRGMQDDFKRDGLMSQIIKRISDLEAFEREFRLKQFGSGTGGGVLWLPFGQYANTLPMTTTPAYPYLATVDRTITFVSWYQHAYVVAPNNGANYWNIKLVCAPAGVYGTVIATIDTSALAAATHSQLSTAAFAPASVAASDIGVWVECTKSGAPGGLFVGGPALEITA